MAAYEQIITDAMRDGGLLDALLALQKAEGYVSEDALSALASKAGVSDAALVAALEKATGVKLGESNKKFSLGWVECLGQCQAAPSMLVNGELHTNVDLEKIPELLGGAK